MSAEPVPGADGTPAADRRALSYAQNLEDYHLWLAFAGKERGRYVDIGGGHPIAGSVSFWFYERGWQGIVVEPQEKPTAVGASFSFLTLT